MVIYRYIKALLLVVIMTSDVSRLIQWELLPVIRDDTSDFKQTLVTAIVLHMLVLVSL